MDQGWVLKYLRTICDLLGLDKPHRKDELIDTILNFLLSPVDTGKEIPTKHPKRKKSSGSAKKGGRRKSGGASKPKKSAASSGSEEEEEEDEYEAPPLKKTKRTSNDNSAKRRGKPSSKRTVSPKKSPSNSELTKVIKDLLKGVNLEEVTMKEMCKKVFDKFPGVDLIGKKDFIKNTVKSIISSTE